MRKYYDAQGNETGTSQGCQGGCGQIALALLGLFLLVLAISAIVH